MSAITESRLGRLVLSAVAPAQAQLPLRVLNMDAALLRDDDAEVSRAELAMALNVALFTDLLTRTPTAAAYVEDRARAGETVNFDHGALRTIRFATGATGALPPGEAAFTRILEPLGYRLAGIYPLERLGMTGRAYAHLDHPESIPQFFLSELHVERFAAPMQTAARQVFNGSRDPLGAEAHALLARMAQAHAADLALCIAGLPQLIAAFARQHDTPDLADYRTLLAHSAEAAWIATEGNAFNHATDRVADVDALAATQKTLGRPMKAAVEVSSSGRVRQTAFKADTVQRPFRDGAREVVMSVPGSFYEFITRDPEPDTGGLDLRFDSGNAQGIFKMTAAGA